MTRLPLRLVLALIAVLATCLGSVSAAGATSSIPDLVNAYTYDTPTYDQVTDYAVYEHGPPGQQDEFDVLAGQRTVDRWSDGTVMRAGVSMTTASCAYNLPASLAHIDSIAYTPSRPGEAINGDRSALRPGFGAANSVEYVTVRPGFTATAGRGGLPGSRPGMPFTKAGKDEVLQSNAASHVDGIARCANPQCSVKLTPGQQSRSGVTPRADEAAVDHVDPRASGGSGAPPNGQGLCRVCNGWKSDGPSPW